MGGCGCGQCEKEGTIDGKTRTINIRIVAKVQCDFFSFFSPVDLKACCLPKG